MSVGAGPALYEAVRAGITEPEANFGTSLEIIELQRLLQISISVIVSMVITMSRATGEPPDQMWDRFYLQLAEQWDL